MSEYLSLWPARGPLIATTTMRDIAEKHAAAAGISLDAMRSPSRARRYFVPRRAAMAEMYATGKFSYPQIGRFFRRDHSSAVHAVSRLRDLEAA